jgi:hypothetical protein
MAAHVYGSKNGSGKEARAYGTARDGQMMESTDDIDTASP